VKKYLIALLAIVFLLGCAAPDRSTEIGRVAQFGWTKLRAMEEGTFTTSTTMTADLRHYRGAVTLWFNPAVGTSDSCSTISMRLYNDESGEWGAYYSGTTKLDTIDRALMNVAAGSADVYMPLAKFNADQFAWGDKIEITWGIGTGDTMNGEVWIGGQ